MKNTIPTLVYSLIFAFILSHLACDGSGKNERGKSLIGKSENASEDALNDASALPENTKETSSDNLSSEPNTDATLPDEGRIQPPDEIDTDEAENNEQGEEKDEKQDEPMQPENPDKDPSEPVVSPKGCDEVTGLLVCEDFEANNIDSAVWNIQKERATGQIDDAKSFTGKKSLHIVSDKENANGYFLYPKNVFPVQGNRFFGRAYLMIDKQSPKGHNHLIKAFSTVDGTSAQHRLDANQLNFNSRYVHKKYSHIHGGLSMPIKEQRGSSYKFPTNKWVCLEWEFDGNNHTMRYWFDGVHADALEVTKDEDPEWTAGKFSNFYIGWWVHQAHDLNLNIYYDSIILALERVGCIEE